jgi:coenzyme F420-reducing hydrogenase beta subunit
MNKYIKEKLKNLCCGCGACVQVCPKNCITMSEDYEGFYYPEVSAHSSCIKCGKCANVCPMESRPAPLDKISADFYAGFTLNKDYINSSSSGGIFPEIARSFIERGGVVCGVAINEAHKVYHTIIESVDELSLLQGSKYVQSDLVNCLGIIEEKLRSGKNLLFTGTPCQVAAVKKTFKSENLYTLDVLCHGVPSQKLFDTYISYLEKKHKGVLTEIVFRDKSLNGWSITQRYKIKKKKKRKEQTYYLDRHISEYFSGFLRNMTQRESCYQCPYTTVNRVGDITLADFWGVDKVRPELYNRAGTSLVLSNSQKGDYLLSHIKENITLITVTKNEAVFQNVNFLFPPERNSNRDFVYKEVYENGFKSTGKKMILPTNAYKYRIWSVLQRMHIVGSVNQRKIENKKNACT